MTVTQKELRIFGPTSSTELHQKPELVGLPGADLKACPVWFQPQPVQNMPHAGEAPVCRLTHPLTLHTDTQAHPQTRPLAGGCPSFHREALPPPASCTDDPHPEDKLKLLPRVWGWVLIESKTLWGACSQGRDLLTEMCVLGLHGCVKGAASSHGPVGKHPPMHVCV